MTVTQKLVEWVESAPTENEQVFRRVIHIVLDAISKLDDRKYELVMKGGILMAIQYQTSRFTRDIDFSTSRHYSEFKETQQDFLDKLNTEINNSSQHLGYGIQCRVQASKVKPREEGNYQTLHINVGYAIQGDTRNMQRLSNGQATSVVSIDYSFNEIIGETGHLQIGNSSVVKVYGEKTLIAEKLRAIIQQENRHTRRRQDIFDLYVLFSEHPYPEEKHQELLKELVDKSHSREIVARKDAMRSDVVYQRSKEEYSNLASEIDGDLPEFDLAYETIRDFYESLPWSDLQ